jgi:hypothetical protein
MDVEIRFSLANRASPAQLSAVMAGLSTSLFPGGNGKIAGYFQF